MEILSLFWYSQIGKIIKWSFCEEFQTKVRHNSSIQLGVIRTFLSPGIYLGLKVLGHIGSNNQTRKIVTIHKDFQLYQIYISDFLC